MVRLFLRIPSEILCYTEFWSCLQHPRMSNCVGRRKSFSWIEHILGKCQIHKENLSYFIMPVHHNCEHHLYFGSILNLFDADLSKVYIETYLSSVKLIKTFELCLNFTVHRTKERQRRKKSINFPKYTIENFNKGITLLWAGNTSKELTEIFIH